MVCIILGSILALALLAWLWQYLRQRFLFPMPMSGTYIIVPRPEQEPYLEQQLRCCRWLRQSGFLRGQIVVVTDALPPQSQRLIQALLQRELADQAMDLEQLEQVLQWEME